MLKYVNTQICFEEVPDQISLCINISNCPCHCINCHSNYLAEDIGTILNEAELTSLIESNKGITCIAFMGGDSDPTEVNFLAEYIKDRYELKIAWYSGRSELNEDINLKNFDFIKLGPYMEELGPLNSKTTNQKFYEVISLNKDTIKLNDITYKFWKND